MKPQVRYANIKGRGKVAFPPGTTDEAIKKAVRTLVAPPPPSPAIKQIESAAKILDNQSRRQSVDVHAANATLAQKFDALAAAMKDGFASMRQSNEALALEIRKLATAETDGRQGLSVMLSAHMETQNAHMEKMEQMMSTPKKSAVTVKRGADGKMNGAVIETVSG